MKKVIHWDLFSGVGMFSYALDQVYGKENTKHIFVEWDAFCTQVLKKHWPEAEYHGDIGEFVAYARSKESRRVSGEQWQEMAKTGEGGGGAIANSKSRQSGKSSEQKGGKDTCRGNLKILTGGFPCQPFSAAGRRRGTRDNRYLWPEMFAVIRNIKPDWVIAENVRGLVTWNEGMVLETVCADMEGIGYEVQPLIIPACAVGAPHRRDRVWIIANDAKNAISKRTRRGYNGFAQGAGKRVESEIQTARPNSDAPNPRHKDAQGHEPVATEFGENEGTEFGSQDRQVASAVGWTTDWREVALATCHDGVDDGLPRRMDGTTISAAGHRTERLKACGNAIVPQVAMEIFKSIKAITP